jgi:hypothetical protein
MKSHHNIRLLIADDQFESDGDPELAEFVGKEERVGIGPAPDQQFSTDRDNLCGKRQGCRCFGHR